MTKLDIFSLISLGQSMVSGVHSADDGRQFITTNFEYPNGDCITVYVQDVGGMCLSDMGVTLDSLQWDGDNLSSETADVIEAVINNHGMKSNGRELLMPLTGNYAEAFRKFCEALIQIGVFQYGNILKGERT